MHDLEHYLEGVCGFEKNEKSRSVPSLGKQKLAFDAAKIKHMIEELCDPMFVHVCARFKLYISNLKLITFLSSRQKSATLIPKNCALQAFQKRKSRG
jgi:hypothetical protein